MAPYTYYYFFSIIAVLTIGLYLVNLVLLKTSGRTTFGTQYKPGTAEYKRINRVANGRNLAIGVILGLIFVGNLLNSINRVVYLNTPDSRFLLVFAPIASVLFLGLMIAIVSKQISGYNLDKRK